MLDWDALSQEERALAVAEDILRWTQGEHPRWNIRNRVYLLTEDSFVFPGKPEDDFVWILSHAQFKCHVCAIGAAFISRVRLFDRLPISQAALIEPAGENQLRFLRMRTELPLVWGRDVFGEKSAALIEAAFECNPVFANHYPEVEVNKAVAFGCSYADPKERVRAVMANVVTNQGTFVPPDHA